MSMTSLWGTVALAVALADPGVIEGDAQDVVFLAVDNPVFVRLHLQVEDQAFRALQPGLVRTLFDAFDADRDQVWSADEQKAAADSGRLGILGNDATYDPTALDKNKNGMLDRDEFVAHALPALGPPILVRADPGSPAKSLPLFEKLDGDDDGRLSRAELQQAWQALRKLDLDDDEMLSLTELLPPETPGAMPVAMDARVDSPVVVLTPEAIPNLAQSLTRRYGGGKLRVPLTALGLPEKKVQPFDTSKDGLLSASELEALLKDPPPHHELLVKLPRGKKGRINLQVLGARSEVRQLSVPITAKGFSAEIRGASTAAAVADNRNFYRIKFLQADGNKNKWLDESEFGMLGLDGTFPQVDRNGDKMVTVQEMLDHLALDDQLNESRIELLVSNDGRSLFELMDDSKDQRISTREFIDTAARLMVRDLNKDQRIDSAELESKVRVSISLDRPKLFQPTTTMMRPMMTGRPPRPVTDAPDWFVKMDRNRDGDVSSREFLGPTAAFEKLDADQNGVLDPLEASAAKS